jgi:hypothetical protein
MFQPGEDWNPLQARLNELIKKKDHFEEMQKLLLEMHSLLHSKEVYGGGENTFLDEIWDGLEDKAFRTMPTSKDDTIAWNIWHITRIEDLTANCLIVGQEQVLDQVWLERLTTKVTNTGNSMTDEEIIAFSKEISQEGLYEYRKAVGRRTKAIIEGLIPVELKRKVPREGIERIAEVGGVAQHPDSSWLLDFWGKKTVAGIIQMPITRHQIVHLNDCVKLRKRIK